MYLKRNLIWQDPLPKRDYELIDDEDIIELKDKILSSGLSITQLVYTAWSSASSYRNSDRKGGANRARIRLEPQISWKVNHPDDLKKIIEVYEKIQIEFNSKQSKNKKVSVADLIVLGGCAAVELAVKKAGFNMTPYIPGRVDALQEQTDVAFYAAIEPFATVLEII